MTALFSIQNGAHLQQSLCFQHALSVRAFSLCTWRRWEAVSCAWWEQLEWSDFTRSSLKL